MTFLKKVALFTRAWIEIFWSAFISIGVFVALFTRAWIEIPPYKALSTLKLVALFTRAWIEIDSLLCCHVLAERRPLHEGVD